LRSTISRIFNLLCMTPMTSCFARWGWNNDVNAPVFSPSVLVTQDQWSPPVTSENLEQWRASPWEQHKVQHVCHSYVGMNNARPGQIEYLNDCTHELAGKIIDLPQLPPFMSTEY
jgi:hypothetical protein